MRRRVLLACMVVLTLSLIGSVLAARTRTRARMRTTMRRLRTPAGMQMGHDLRQALGFGDQDMAVLGVDADTHRAIAQAASDYCDAHGQTVGPLVDGYRTAKQAAFRAYELGENVDSAEQALTTAVGALAAGCTDATTSMTNLLTADQGTSQSRRAGHERLEATLAVLDLSADQYTALADAQRNRDLVLRHYKDRKNPARISDAYAAFDQVVAGVLTPQQVTQSGQINEGFVQRLASAEAVEESLTP